MKYFERLTRKDFVYIILLIAIGFGWILIDQVFFAKTGQRIMAFAILMMGLYFILFVVKKPVSVWHYANSAGILTLSIMMATGLILHVLIRNDFSSKSVFIWIITATTPYLSSFLYIKFIRKRLKPAL